MTQRVIPGVGKIIKLETGTSWCEPCGKVITPLRLSVDGEVKDACETCMLNELGQTSSDLDFAQRREVKRVSVHVSELCNGKGCSNLGTDRCSACESLFCRGCLTVYYGEVAYCHECFDDEGGSG